MKIEAVVITIVCLLTLGMLIWFGTLDAEAKETTTLDEAINRNNSDREVVMVEDKKHGYICYYRKTADGISCVPYPYR